MLLRQGLWQGWLARRDPLAASMAYHALTVGGIGGMILAIITRVPLGHTGRAFVLPKGGVWIYWLVLLAAVCRVFAVAPGLPQRSLMVLANGGWVAAFMLWIVLYWPIITQPRVDG